MIITGDKIKLVQKIGSFDKVGDIFEVTGVDNGVVSFKYDDGTGCMSYNEFEKYFEKIEVVKRTWSDWEVQKESFVVKNATFSVKVRNNGKKVQVRCNGYKAEASCCDDDTFDFSKGYELAKKRLFAKMIHGLIEDYAKTL